MSDNITIDVKLDKINVQRPSVELINQVEQNTSDITSLEESVSVIENNITENNIDIDNLQTNTIQNSDNIILITQDLKTLKIRVSSLTYRVDNLPDIEPINIAIDDLLSRVTAMENGELDITIIDELVVQVNDLLSRVTALEENSGGLSEISNLTFTDAIGQEINVYDGLEEKTIKLPYIDWSMIDMEDEQQQEMLMMSLIVFVDSVNGDDENEGTMESPVKTLDVALIKALQKPNIHGRGQIGLMGLIVLMDGTYQIGEVSETGYSTLSVSCNTAIMAMGSDVTINGVVSVEKDANLQIDSDIALNLYDYSTISGNLACGNLNFIHSEYSGDRNINVEGEIKADEIDCEKGLVIGTNGKVTCNYLKVGSLDISGYLKVNNSISIDYNSSAVQVISVKGTIESDELLVSNYPIYNTSNILYINNGTANLRSITIDGTTNFLNVIYATSNGQVYVDTLTVTSKANDCPDSCVSANYGSNCSIRNIILNCNNTNESQSNLSFSDVIQCNTGAKVYFDTISTSDVTHVGCLLNADGGLIQYNTTNILGNVLEENITAKGGRIFSGEQFDIGEEVLEEIKVVLENNGINMTDVPIENYPQTVEQAISSSSGGGGLSVTIISPTVNEEVVTHPVTFEWLVGVEEGIEVISYLFVNDELVYVGTERSATISKPMELDSECYVFVIKADNSTAGVSTKITFTFEPFLFTMGINGANVISYPSDSLNHEFTPVNSITAPNQLNEFENFINYMFTPMMFDGITEKPLKRDDYSLLADGLTPSDISNESLNYDAVVKINPIYVNATVDSETKLITRISFSSHRLNETWDAPGFYNSSGEIVPVYLGIYKNSMINGIMRSLSNKSIYSNENLSNHKNAISAKGNNWHMCSFNLRMTLNILCLLLAKNKNLLTTLGAGISPSLGLTTGVSDALGMFWGSTSKNDTLKVFGIENLWGNRSEYIDGLYKVDLKYYIKKKPPFVVNTVTSDSVMGRYFANYNGRFIGRLTFEDGVFFFLDDKAQYENSQVSGWTSPSNYTGRLSMGAHDNTNSASTQTGAFGLRSEGNVQTSRLLYIPE